MTPELNPKARSGENLRLGFLFCVGFALASGVAAIVGGSNLDSFGINFSFAGVDLMRQEVKPGDARFDRYKLLFQIVLGSISLGFARGAWSCWRALNEMNPAAKRTRTTVSPVRTLLASNLVSQFGRALVHVQ